MNDTVINEDDYVFWVIFFGDRFIKKKRLFKKYEDALQYVENAKPLANVTDQIDDTERQNSHQLVIIDKKKIPFFEKLYHTYP